MSSDERQQYLSPWTRRLRVAFYVCLSIGLAATLLLLTFVALQNQATGNAIRDCTTPGHSCFDRAAKRQAQVIGDPPAPINNVVVLASYCARVPGNDTAAEVRACVLKGLQTPSQ